MPGKLNYKDIEPDCVEFLRKNGAEITHKEMSTMFNYSEAAMWSIIRRYKLPYKTLRRVKGSGKKEKSDYRYARDKPKVIVRPPAEYSNHSPYGIAS